MPVNQEEEGGSKRCYLPFDTPPNTLRYGRVIKVDKRYTNLFC